MRTKLKDFKLPETWHIKIQSNNYNVLNNWCKTVKSAESILREYCEHKRIFYLDQNGRVTKYKPASKFITFPQFRKYVYPNIIPPIEKRVVEVTQEKDFDVDKWFKQKEKPDQYGFYIGNHLNGALYNTLPEVQMNLQKTLSDISTFDKGFIFKVVKTITKKTTYEVE